VSGRPASEDGKDKVSQIPFRRGAGEDAEFGKFEDGDFKIKKMWAEKENADGFLIFPDKKGVRGRLSEIDDPIYKRLDFRPRWEGGLGEFYDRTTILPPILSLSGRKQFNDGGKASE
jgi:hypothetical protein